MLAPMPSSPRKVVIVAFPDVQMLDVVGPAEVFGTAERLQPGRYQVELVARARGPLRTSSGIPILPRAVLSEVRGPIDTLIVAGGVGVYEAAHDRELVAWVKRRARTCRRVASVCSGAFLLAEAGLLDGRRATTHWAAAENLAERYPRVTVDADPIFIRDGNVWTSAGVAAGIDLSLALVTDDHGPRVAREIARWLVLFLQRAGGQSQFSVQLAAQAAERRPLRDLQSFIADHPSADLSVPALAERCGMSPRHFARVFRRELGMTPAAYVERSRLDAARRMLESSEMSLDEVAAAAGFGSAATMYRVFQRALRVSPGAYRRHFVAPLPERRRA
ncbi:MAG TPA: GlxA family transcriptional regulator [Candidatus Binatia bacterium]